jgi:X-X-X-Leu-X-X-Gly heptad repeat protein
MGILQRHSVIAAFVGGALVFGGAAFAASFTPFTAGETLSASKLNANLTALQDRISALESGAEQVAAGYAKLVANGPPTPSGTPVRFSERRFDSHNAYNSGTGVFTVPAGRGGVYSITASVCGGRSGNGASNDAFGVIIKVNGAVVADNFRQFLVATAKDDVQAVHVTHRVSAGDQVTIEVASNTTAPRFYLSDNPGYNYVTIARVAN